LATFVLLVAIALALLLPLLEQQLVGLLTDLPALVASLKARALPLMEGLAERLAPEDVERLRTAAGNSAGTLVGWLAAFARGVFSSAFTVVDLLSVLVITPMVAFYLLRDWDRLIA